MIQFNIYKQLIVSQHFAIIKTIAKCCESIKSKFKIKKKIKFKFELIILQRIILVVVLLPGVAPLGIPNVKFRNGFHQLRKNNGIQCDSDRFYVNDEKNENRI